MQVPTSFLLSLPFFSRALGLAISPRHVLYGRSNSGIATFYGGNLQGGACGFSTMTSLPSGVYGTATANWDSAAHCGQCASVTRSGGSTITVMIVDQCPGCSTNQLDLFPDAFSALDSNTADGQIDISWDYIDCPISSPLSLVNKEGVSQYWFAMQVIDATEQVSNFEVSSDGGSTWTSVTRDNDNFFTLSSGTDSTSVDVRLTGASGSSLTVNDVAINTGQTVTATGNLGTTFASTSSSGSNISPSSSSSAAPSVDPSAGAGVASPSSSSAAPEPTPVTPSSDDGDDGSDDACAA